MIQYSTDLTQTLLRTGKDLSHGTPLNLTHECGGDAELPLHAAAEVLGYLVPLVRQSQVGDHRGYLGLDDGSVLALEVERGRIMTRIGIMKHFFGDIKIEIKSETNLSYYKIELWRNKIIS